MRHSITVNIQISESMQLQWLIQIHMIQENILSNHCTCPAESRRISLGRVAEMLHDFFYEFVKKLEIIQKSNNNKAFRFDVDHGNKENQKNQLLIGHHHPINECYHGWHQDQNKRFLKQIYNVKFLKLLLLTKKNLIPKKYSKCSNKSLQMSGKDVGNYTCKKDYL